MATMKKKETETNVCDLVFRVFQFEESVRREFPIFAKHTSNVILKKKEGMMFSPNRFVKKKVYLRLGARRRNLLWQAVWRRRTAHAPRPNLAGSCGLSS